MFDKLREVWVPTSEYMKQVASRRKNNPYDPKLAMEITTRMGNGESIMSVCRDEHMPELAIIWWWIDTNEEFKEMYREARVRRLEIWAEEILDVADNGINDWMERETKKGNIQVSNHDHINRSRLRVDSRKWLLSKLKPSEYGDRLHTKVENVVESMTQEQIDAQLTLLLKHK